MSTHAATNVDDSTRLEKGASRRNRWGSRGWLFVIPLVALWVVPVVLFVALIPFSRAAESSATAAGPVRTVTVGSRTDSGQQAVDATVTAPAPPQVKSTAAGIVTAVHVTPAAKIENGAALLGINGSDVLAYVAPSPLYRDLSVGSKGADVQAFVTYLAALHLLPAGAAATSFTASVATGASALETRLGLPADGNFHLSEVAWVPPATTTAGSVKVQVGDTVNTGDVILEGTSTPTSISFGNTGDQTTKPAFQPGALRLSAGTLHVDVKSLTLSADDRTAIAAFYARAVAAGNVTSTAGTGTTIYTGATLSTLSTKKVGVVPSSAIYQSPAGTTCIFTSTKGQYRGVALSSPELLVGEPGSVSVPANLAGRSIVRDPTSLSSAVRSTCR